MRNFLFEYGWIILVAIAIIALFVFTCVKLYKEKGKLAMLEYVRQQAYKLMLLAEKKYGQGHGEFKFNYVIERLYPILPNTFKVIFTEEELEDMVQNWYMEAKDYLDDGQANDSI